MIQPDHRTAIEALIRAEARPVDKFSHQPRLYHLAVRLAEGLDYDDDVLHAAAWLHDLGVFVGHRPEDPDALARWDCVAYATTKAPEVLARGGFPKEKIPGVVEAIRCHQPESQPTTMEGIILRDADILEQLGSVAVLRTDQQDRARYTLCHVRGCLAGAAAQCRDPARATRPAAVARTGSSARRNPARVPHRR